MAPEVSGVDVEGIIVLSTLSRLSESLLNNDGDVTVRIECGTDQQGLTVLQGTATCLVSVKCERCGEAMPLTLDCSFAYTPVNGDDDAALELIPERYDVIERNEHGEINLRPFTSVVQWQNKGLIFLMS